MRTVFRHPWFVPALICYGLSSLWAQEHPSETLLKVPSGPWLLAGPIDTPPPAFSVEGSGDLLEVSALNLTSLWPGEGEPIAWPGGIEESWKRAEAAEDTIRLAPGQGGEEDGIASRTAWLAGYIETFRRTALEVEVSSFHPVVLYLNGEEKGETRTADRNGDEPSKTVVKLTLACGKHRLVLKTARPAGDADRPWFVKIEIRAQGEEGSPDAPEWSIDPTRTFASLAELKYLRTLTNPALSPEGGALAVQVSGYPGPKQERATWIEILQTATGRRDQVLRLGRSTHSPRWSPDGGCLLFRSGSSLWCYRPEDKALEELFNEKGLGTFFWSPDGRSIYYTKQSEKPDPGDYERLWDPRDRLTDWDETVTLHRIEPEAASRQTLTRAGSFAFTQAAVSPDGSRLALVRRIPMEGRPFFESEFWVMELAPQKLHRIKKARFPFENGPARLTWSPDGRQFAFTAPPGETLPPGQGAEHNAFDTCLYLLDTETKALTRLSDRFGESVESDLWWRSEDGKIYFIAQHRAFRKMARLDPKGQGGIEFLEVPLSVVSAFTPARKGNKVAVTGSSLDHPDRIFLIDLESGRTSLVYDPNAAYMRSMRSSDWERFDFDNARGDPIDGWIFYPPRFDASRAYPMIVYYYGGVSPRQERFAVLYSHWLAANGYVLYILNPTGAVGLSHALSDKHCNDWGEIAAQDVIEGVERVLAAKPFIDRARIGCYGGSYGGFMTMSLITKTDLFRAACSMYGISNLASYWGGGIWGYTYGDTAMAGRYPWTHPDFFVDRSPLYHAHKINAALLLLHGVADQNVPSLESEQMFTALRVLGKEVAYVRFKDEDHGIAGKRSNLLAHRAMILEWFDKYLKDQGEAWDDRWKK
jgi:dipeptidyl aminopeptidase/acylaminoacyl peptidase